MLLHICRVYDEWYKLGNLPAHVHIYVEAHVVLVFGKVVLLSF